MHWKRNVAKAAAVAAFIAGGYFCTIGAYDHARPPRGPVAVAGAPADEKVPATKCFRDSVEGMSCVEEMEVVAPRRPRAVAVLVSGSDERLRDPAERPSGRRATDADAGTTSRASP